MKGMRFIIMSVLAIFFVIGISLSSALALDWDHWQDKWFKIKIKINATCEDISNDEQEIDTDSVKDIGGIYIGAYRGGFYDACLISRNDDGTWQSTYVRLTILLGSADDAVLGTENVELIEDGDRVVDYLFTIRLIGKEKKEEFKSGKLKSVSGTAWLYIEDEVDCIAFLSVSGKYLKLEKVPDEIISLPRCY